MKKIEQSKSGWRQHTKIASNKNMEDGYKSLKLILDYLYIERRYENLEV